MSLTRMTRKGQITLPKDVRETLGIEQSDYVVVVVDGDKAILSPVREEKLADLKGKLPATRPHPGVEDVRRAVGCELGKRGRKTAK